MAKSKQAGKTRQGVTRPGKRLGVKIFGGQKVISGTILVRQKGSKFHPDTGVRMGRDHTLYAIKEGTVQYLNRRGKKLVAVQ